MRNKIIILNQLFWPDKINTARHISELAEELVKRGWDVTALVGDRLYKDHKTKIRPEKGVWNGVNYSRINTPAFNQKKNIPRLLTSLWFLLAWVVKIPIIANYDAVILGTNPPFSYFIVPLIKIYNKKIKILMWGFDLYPEAIIASKNNEIIFFEKPLKLMAKFCYRKLDVIVDIGPCMRSIYRQYYHNSREETLTPWSFVEPNRTYDPHLPTRKELFGNANLTLLYTGTIGYAHDFDLFLKLARELNKRDASIGFCFAGFGNLMNDLKSKITDLDTNISFAGFVKTDHELKNRLSSADIMLISLKDNWTGISVPSKFFSAIAMGKAVLFSGSSKSALSVWTKTYNLGYQLDNDNIYKIADTLSRIAKRPSIISKFKKNSNYTYHKEFSKKNICDNWSKLLKETIEN